MGKGFKLPGKLPGAPNKLAMPAVQGGGSYRNPAMIIDRSAEILGAGVQAGMDKIGDALKQKAMDKISEEKGEEPKSNVDKELQKTKLDSFVDRSNAILNDGVVIDTNKFPEFKTTNAKGLDTSYFGPPMVDDELAAVGANRGVNVGGNQLASPSQILGGREGGFAGLLGKGIQATQAQQAAAASTAAGGTMGAADQNPMTVGAIPQGGGKFQLTPVAMSYDPPLQANEKGNKTPVFNLATQGMAETAFGTPAMRQASVGAAFKMKNVPEGDEGKGLRSLPNEVVKKMGYDPTTK